MLPSWVSALMVIIQPDYPAHFVKEVTKAGVIVISEKRTAAVVVDMWAKLQLCPSECGACG
jgi:hypothetical protein